MIISYGIKEHGVSVVKLVFLTFFVSCSNLMYQPSKLVFHDPTLIKLQKKEVSFKSLDGVNLHGWIVSDSNLHRMNKGLITLFHGNAENLTSHYLAFAWLVPKGYDLFVFDYRGYGNSEGSVSPKGILQDSIAALNYSENLLTEKNYSSWIVIGQSLGGSLVLKSLSERKNIQNKVSLVILDSSFRSNSKESAALLRTNFITFLFSPLAYVLMHDTYNATLKDLNSWSIPTLIVAHKDDPVVISYQSNEIFNQISSLKKWIWVRTEKPSGHINSFYYPNGPWNEKLWNFLNGQNLNLK